MNKFFLRFAAFFGFTAVALGAFAAHAIKDRLSLRDIAIFQTGVHYQLIHAVVLLFIALAAPSNPKFKHAGYAFLAGITIFSGSLYLLVLTQTRWLGAITPIGGLSFLAGWALLALAVKK